jgi:hypothetical protein
MIGALRRKLTKHVPPPVLGEVYAACIRAVLEYGSSAWDPVLKGDIAELERCQLYAMRLYLNDFTVSYNDALIRTGWSSLYDRRKRSKLCQFYKFYRNLHDCPFNDHEFLLKSDVQRVSSRFFQPHHLVLPRHFTDSYKQSFMFSGATLWNNLPCDTAMSDYPRFKDLISKVIFNS